MDLSDKKIVLNRSFLGKVNIKPKGPTKILIINLYFKYSTFLNIFGVNRIKPLLSHISANFVVLSSNN